MNWGNIFSLIKTKESIENGNQKEKTPYQIEDDPRIKIQLEKTNIIINKRLKPITIEIKLDEKKENNFEQTFVSIHDH